MLRYCCVWLQDPYFNEPSVDLMRGTTEGALTSMRWAKAGQEWRGKWLTLRAMAGCYSTCLAVSARVSSCMCIAHALALRSQSAIEGDTSPVFASRSTTDI